MKKLLFLLFLSSCFNKSINISPIKDKGKEEEKASKDEVAQNKLVEFNPEILNIDSFNQLYDILLSGKMITNVNYIDESGYTPLMLAASVFKLHIQEEEIVNKAIFIIKSLLKEEETDVNIRERYEDKSVLSILSSSVNEKAGELVSTLLKKEGIEVNRRNKEGLTPLILSIQKEAMSAFKELVSNEKIDVNMTSEHGFTPLYYALISDNKEVRKEQFRILLSDPQIDVNIHNNNIAILIDALNEDVEEEIIVMLLDQENINIDLYYEKDRGQNISALILAVQKGMKIAVEKIVKKIKENNLDHIITFKYLSKNALQHATEEKNKYMDGEGKIIDEDKYYIYSEIERIVLELESSKFARDMTTIGTGEIKSILEKAIREKNTTELEAALAGKELSEKSYTFAMGDITRRTRREKKQEKIDILSKIKEILEKNNPNGKREE